MVGEGVFLVLGELFVGGEEELDGGGQLDLLYLHQGSAHFYQLSFKVTHLELVESCCHVPRKAGQCLNKK